MTKEKRENLVAGLGHMILGSRKSKKVKSGIWYKRVKGVYVSRSGMRPFFAEGTLVCAAPSGKLCPANGV